MHIRHAATLLQLAVWLAGSGAVTASAQNPQIDQTVLANQLLQGDRTTQMEAIAMIGSIAPREITPPLQKALVSALEREGILAEQRARGEIGYLQHPLLLPKIAAAVIPLRDPASIPGLVGAMAMSPPALHALADFGNPAVQPIIDAMASTASIARLNGGLIALRLMVEASNARAKLLSDSSIAVISRVAEERLTKRQESVATLWMAIDLAIALGDPELRTIVQSIAEGPDTVKSRVEEELDLLDIEKTQKRAAERLAGVPPLPRRR